MREGVLDVGFHLAVVLGDEVDGWAVLVGFGVVRGLAVLFGFGGGTGEVGGEDDFAGGESDVDKGGLDF
jgi:hypothetical protein